MSLDVVARLCSRGPDHHHQFGGSDMRVHFITRSIIVVLSLSILVFIRCSAQAQGNLPVSSPFGYLHPAMESSGSYSPGIFMPGQGDGAKLATNIFTQGLPSFLWRSGGTADGFYLMNETTQMCIDTDGVFVVQRACADHSVPSEAARRQRWYQRGTGPYQILQYAGDLTKCATVDYTVYNWFFPCCRSLPVILRDCPSAGNPTPPEQLWHIGP